MSQSHPRQLHVAFLTGYIPPYALPVLQEINRRVGRLSVLVSTEMEKNRRWEANWEGLDVRVQKTWTLPSRWRHGIGFCDRKETHVPIDTISQLRRLRPDVVVSEELGFRSLACGLYQRFHRQTPLILVCNLSEHTERGRGWVRLLLRRWLAGCATAATANGVSGLRYLTATGFRQNSLYLFPYVSQPGLFETLPLERHPETARRLIYVGELSERKGILPFVHRLSQWIQRDSGRSVALQVLGTGPLEQELKSFRGPSELLLDMRGHCNYDEIRAALAEAGLLVFPTFADEWGLVVNEGLAAGLPVIGSKFSQAVDELIVEGRNGWQFDPSDELDTYRVLDRVFGTSDSSLSAMRLQCRQSVAERTPAWAADQFMHVLQAACAAIRIE